MQKICLLLILILILIYLYTLNIDTDTDTDIDSKSFNLIEELSVIKNKFNKNKKKFIFNKNNLPIKIETETKNINGLFNLLFKNSNIKFKNIIDIKIQSIETQKIHEIIFDTNYGLILVIMISEKKEKEDIFNDLEKIIENNYLLKLDYLNNYDKKNDELDIDNYLQNKIKNLIIESGIDLNPSIKMFDLNNIM